MNSPVIFNKILEQFSFLNDVFASKPQKENFWIQFFCITLSDKCTINGFSDWLNGWKNQSTLNRFLSESKWKVSTLMKKYNLFLKKFLAKTKGPVYAIIDDTKKEKTGEATALVFRNYDPNDKRYLFCHTLTTAILKVGATIFPFRFEAYDKKSGISKLDHAEKMIKKILKIAKPIFLFDSWYCCPQIIDLIVKEKENFVSRLKVNRTVKISGFWKKLSELKGLVKPWQFRKVRVKNQTFYACSSILEVKNLGIFNIIFVKKYRYGKEMEFFITNIPDETEEKILNHYAERWDIEVFFRSIKQDFGLDAAQLRKGKNIRRHWVLVQIAYAIISFLKQRWKRNCKTIGDTIKRLKKEMKDYGIDLRKLIEFHLVQKNAKA